MHEMTTSDRPEAPVRRQDTAYTTADIVRLLDSLLEGERAGARALNEMSRDVDDRDLKRYIEGVARDEGYFCAMLARHLLALEAKPSRRTGRFYEAYRRRVRLADQLDLLDRGQRAVIRTLDEAIPHLDDPRLKVDLEHMQAVHELNVEGALPYLATN